MSNDDKALVSAPKATEIATFYDSTRLQEMGRLATAFFKAGCFGQDVKNEYQALVKIQAGFEMGMAPMEAMGSLYIVNGKITIYGSAMSLRLRQNGWAIEYKEQPDSCTVTIRKGKEEYSYTATIAELKKLRSKAAEFAPREKLKWHALSRIIRFYVPEVLQAGVSYLKEEIEDLPMEDVDVSVVPTVDEVVAKGKVEDVTADIGELTEEEAREAKRRIVEAKKEQKSEEVAPKEEEPEKAWKKEKSSSFFTPAKISEMIKSFTTTLELRGFADEIGRRFNDGEITETVWTDATKQIQERNNELVDVAEKGRRENNQFPLDQ